MRYWPLLAGYLLFASPVVMAAEGDTAAPTAETDGATSPSGGGTEAPAPDGGGSGGSDPGCD